MTLMNSVILTQIIIEFFHSDHISQMCQTSHRPVQQLLEFLFPSMSGKLNIMQDCGGCTRTCTDVTVRLSVASTVSIDDI